MDPGVKGQIKTKHCYYTFILNIITQCLNFGWDKVVWELEEEQCLPSLKGDTILFHWLINNDCGVLLY